MTPLMSPNTLSLLHLFSLGSADLWLAGNVPQLSLLAPPPPVPPPSRRPCKKHGVTEAIPSDDEDKLEQVMSVRYDPTTHILNLPRLDWVETFDFHFLSRPPISLSLSLEIDVESVRWGPLKT